MHIWFRCDVITLISHQRALQDNMVGQEVGIYGVFIGINNEPCLTLPLSLHILNTLGHFNFVLLLFLHKTIPLRNIGKYFPTLRWRSGCLDHNLTSGDGN